MSKAAAGTWRQSKPKGFAPVRMAPLLKLAQVEALSDPQMVNELATQVTRAGAPAPSVETILHAVLAAQICRSHPCRRGPGRSPTQPMAKRASAKFMATML